MSSQTKVLILDGNNLAYKSMVLDDFRQANGIGTSVTFGLLRSLYSLLKQFDTKYFIFTWDCGGSRKRKKLLPQYKQHRKSSMSDPEHKAKMDEFFRQLTTAKKVLSFLKIPQLTISGIEADDLVSILANVFAKKFDATIVSSDKDILQCVKSGVSVYNSHKKRLYDSMNFERTFGVTPDQYLFARTMIGDKSDNIPGIHRVGDKTAFKLVKELTNPDKWNLSEVLKQPEWKKKKISTQILSSFDLIEKNIKLMKLPITYHQLDLEDKNNYLKVVNKDFIKSIFITRSVEHKKFLQLMTKMEFFSILKNKKEYLSKFNIRLIGGDNET